MEPVPQDSSLPKPSADQIGNLDVDPGQRSLGPAPRKSAGIGLWLRDLLVSAAASVLIITFLYQPVRVEGTSMLPRLEDSDRLFINKFVYRFTAIERGRCGRLPLSPRPGEELYQAGNRPARRPFAHRSRPGLAQRQAAPREYVPEEYRDSRSMAEIVIPEDSYFMMGDHRSISSDSREFGPVDRSLIYGKAVFVYWPARDAGVVR
jgi:signal peptidase I